MTPVTSVCASLVCPCFLPVRSFVAKLPLQQLTALQTLCLQQIHVHTNSWPYLPTATADCGHPPQQPWQLTRLVVDSSLSSLFWALKGEGLRQLCSNVEELEVGAGPHDSSAEGQEWADATDLAFMFCYRACPRLRTLRVANQFVSAWVSSRTG